MYGIIICATIPTLRQFYLAVCGRSSSSDTKDETIPRLGLSELLPIPIDLPTNPDSSQESAVKLTGDDVPMRRISGNQSIP